MGRVGVPEDERYWIDVDLSKNETLLSRNRIRVPVQLQLGVLHFLALTATGPRLSVCPPAPSLHFVSVGYFRLAI
jgi:hypothetical protein